MSESIFNSDESKNPDSIDPRYDRLRRIATYQRWVLFSLLANIGMNVTLMMDLVPDDSPLDLAESILAVCVLIFSLFALFKLAAEFYSVPRSVLWAALLIVPLVGLITLLIVNQKASTFLQQNGYPVGLFGINPNEI
ncbi:MAG: hypothetical protein AAGD11_15305 [Planctomycetota bacterium]